jgi:spore maturation protein CgeB
MNLNAFFLAECYNDRICKSRFTSKEEAERAINCDVFIYGNLYPYRYKMIEELISKGINVKIFGFTSHYFPSILKPNYYYPVFGQEKCDMIFGSKIVFNNFHYAEIGSVNEKYFVINGSGGFQICDQKDEVKDFSAVDIERFTFKNIQHAIDLIKYYLKNQSERLEIAKIQQKNCAQYHTYDIRMQQLLNIIFS